jgi:ribosome recycling factor
MFNFADFDHESAKIMSHAEMEIGALRTGGASISMLDGVVVEAYGGQMKVSEVASISTPDPTLITISPWDKSLLASIAKGIQQANINLNPIVDGEIIRISVPALTEETRKEQVKMLKQRVENCKVMVRGLRTDTKKDIEKQEGEPGISDDNIAYDLEALEERTKKLTDTLDAMAEKKEKQLLTM